MTRPTVLVTGASGFLGRALVGQLLADGVHVRAFDRMSGPEMPGVDRITGDIRDQHQLTECSRGVDAIFHLAAYVHDHRSTDDTAQQHAITLGGTVAVLGAAEAAAVEHVILASSLAVFGPVGSTIVDESRPCRPDTPYGRAKLAAEEALGAFTARTGAFGAAIRPAMMYGIPCPGNLPRMIRAVHAGWFPPLPEFGNRRSMVDVDDVARAMRLAWKVGVRDGRPYIVTDGGAYSTREIRDMIVAALGRTPSRFAIPHWLFSAGARAGDLAGRMSGHRMPFDSKALERLSGSALFDPARARLELGFTPSTTLPEVLPALVCQVVEPS